MNILIARFNAIMHLMPPCQPRSVIASKCDQNDFYFLITFDGHSFYVIYQLLNRLTIDTKTKKFNYLAEFYVITITLKYEYLYYKISPDVRSTLLY